MTRLYPHQLRPPLQDPTPRYVELLTIRHAISRIASMITQDPKRIEWAVEELEALIEALRVMTAPQPPGSPQKGK